MEKAFRKIGIDIIGDAPWGTHFCQFYETREDLVDILVPYFKAGVENNEFCMWITSEPLKVEDAKASLKKVVKNLDHFIKKGQIEILDYSEWYTKSGKFDAKNVLQGWVEKENQALKRGYDGLRLSGNTFWLGKKDWRNFTDYEEEINNLIGKYRMIAICNYSLGQCGASKVIDVVSNHQFALIRREGKWVIIESSERKRAEEEYRTILHTTIDGFWIVDMQGRFLEVNDAYCCMIGYCRDELLTMGIQDVEAVERPEETARRIQKIMEVGGDRFGTRHRCKDGKIIDIEVSVNHMEVVGGRMFVFLRDITARKRAEEALRVSEQQWSKTFDAINDSVCLIDPDGRFLKHNQATQRLLGKAASELNGHFCFEVVHGSSQPIAGCPIERMKETNRRESAVIQLGDRWLEVTTDPVLDNDQRLAAAVHIIKDITERKRAEEALQASEKQFKTSVENMLDCFGIYSAIRDPSGLIVDFRIDYVNEATCRNNLMTREEQIGKRLCELLPAHRETGLFDAYCRVVETGEPLIMESVSYEDVYREQRLSRVFSIRGSKLGDGFAASWRDITERKWAEEEIKNLAKFPTENPFPVLRLKQDGIILYANEASQVLLRDWGCMVGGYAPKFWCDLATEALASQSRRTIDVGCGQQVYSFVVAPISDAGYVNLYGQDITERKQAEETLRETEELYRTVLQASPDGISINDTEDRITFVSERMLSLFGLIQPEDVIGHSPFEFIAPEDHAQARLNIQDVFKNNYTGYHEYTLVKKDGTKFTGEINSSLLRDASGKPRGLISIIRDITERKRTEEERERLLAEIAAKNQELESFVYTISHDLRAPLVSLNGFSSVLQKEYGSQVGEKGKHYLERIRANVAHMEDLTTSLLELSRIGQVVGSIEEIDMAVLVREVQVALAVRLKETVAEFVVQEPLPTVRADRGRIHQVFVNLIDNAVKFRSAERALRIEMGCRQESGFYRFHVADNGIGIAPQYQEQIFTPFRKLHLEIEGVGIGLALVKKIVESHGGRVWVESPSAEFTPSKAEGISTGNEGAGATFYFTLPIERGVKPLR